MAPKVLDIKLDTFQSIGRYLTVGISVANVEMESTLQIEGKVTLLPGSKIVYASGEFILNNTNASLEFRGGQLQLVAQAALTLQANEGTIDVYSMWNETDVTFASGSRMLVEGMNQNNTFLRIHEGAMFNESGTANYIKFKNGKIELNENATLLSYQRLLFENTNMIGSENALCRVDYNTLSFLNASIAQCKIENNYGKLS